MNNMLSPEAKEFIPRISGGPEDDTGDPGQTALKHGLDPAISSTKHGLDPLATGMGQNSGFDAMTTGHYPMNGVPSYMTTCYPFVAAGDPSMAGRPRGRGAKFGHHQQHPMYMAQQFSPMQTGMPRNRLPTPGKSFLQGQGHSNWDPGNGSDFYHNFGHNGMPFDGGTYHQNGYIRPNLNQMATPRYPVPGGMTDGSVPAMNGLIDSKKSKQKNKKQANKSDREGTTSVSRAGTAKVNLKTTAIQTDLPAHIANRTLDELPNTLYKKFSHSNHHGNDLHRQTSVTFDQGQNRQDHSVDLVTHKRHSGTSPLVDFPSQMSPKPSGPANGYQINGNVTSQNAPIGGLGLLGAYSGFNSNYVHGDNVSSMQNSYSAVPYVKSNDSSAVSNSGKLSYASIAQKAPSQPNVNKVAKQLPSNSVVMAAGDRNKCDAKNSQLDSKRKVPNSGISNKTRYGKIDVAEIMEDLERADAARLSGSNSEKVKVSETGSSSAYHQPVATATSSSFNTVNISVKGVFSYSSAVQHGTNSMNIPSALGGSVAKPLQVVRNGADSGYRQTEVNGLKQSVASVNSHQNVKQKQDNVTADLRELMIKTQNQGQSDGNEGDVKKKRRRRRRRKKKDGGEVDDNEGGNSGANEDITLHFEDEEEFPDLGGVAVATGNYVAANKNAVPAHGVPVGTREEEESQDLDNGPSSSISYSEILKNTTSVQSGLSSQDEGQLSAGAAGNKESRSSRKRRKRREVANKAADAEMAEIGLEQHMLELKMKQKLPLAAKKSVSPVRSGVSPVRNAATQGVWKLTPSSPTTQPSSSGKKVSLLLPGTVATEPSHNTPPQPNTVVKQPGILKTSQPISNQNTSGNASSSSINAGSSGGKKSKQPIMFDIAALLEKKKEAPPPKKEVKAATVKKDEIRPHNILDSTAPLTKRGKERETPKAKKPSPLKKVILKEREEKKRLRMLDEDEVNAGAPVGIGVVSGGESDLSQDATSYQPSMEVGLGTPASAELSPISQPSPSFSPMSPGASPLSSGVNSPITGTVQQTVKLKIHSRRFREYCNQVLDKEIDNHVAALLQDLVRFQDRQYHKDPVKAKSKRRFVLGLREVTKHLKLKKVKCVVISPNLEKIQSKGGLDDALNTILDLCSEQDVPFIFALGRRALGRACAKLVPVSVVGIFNYEGSEENFKLLIQLTDKAREQYREMIVQIEKEIAEHPPRVSVPGVPHIFAHMGHSRTPSGCSVISFTSSILSEPISENYPHSEPETDNRGYEIEHNDVDDDVKDVDSKNTNDDDNDDDDDVDDDSNSGQENDTAYEADDEYEADKRRKKKTATRDGNKGVTIATDVIGGQSYVVNSGDDLRITGDAAGNTCANRSTSIVRRPGILKNSGDRLKYRQIESRTKSDENQHNAQVGNSGDSVNNSSQSMKGNSMKMSEKSANVLDSNVGSVISNNPKTIVDSCSWGDTKADVNTAGDKNDSGSDKEELKFDTCEEDSESCDSEMAKEATDKVNELSTSYISSVHQFDIAEVLSQHSAKTVENCDEVLSTHSSKTTHSSRTLGEGSALGAERSGKTLHEVKNTEALVTPSPNASTLVKGKSKAERENRTLTWVQETPFKEHAHEESNDLDDSALDVSGVKMEYLDAVA